MNFLTADDPYQGRGAAGRMECFGGMHGRNGRGHGQIDRGEFLRVETEVPLTFCSKWPIVARAVSPVGHDG